MIWEIWKVWISLLGVSSSEKTFFSKYFKETLKINFKSNWETDEFANSQKINSDLKR